MKRVVFAVGCDEYAYVPSLNACHTDAQNVFDRLMDPNVGSYDADNSKLLLSPSLSEFRTALTGVLFDSGPIDVFTLYFAGHGEAAAGSFYMAVKDTRIDRLSASALSLSEVLLYIIGASPRSLNIIIDACFSGGLAKDIEILTRPDDAGNAGTLNATLLAMSARDQISSELPGIGGIGTSILVECIDGSVAVQDHSESLTLSEIGEVVSCRIESAGGQNPVVWVANQQRRPVFCRNPTFRRRADEALSKWSPRTFADSVDPLLRLRVGEPAKQIVDLNEIVKPLIIAANSARDAFKLAQVHAAHASVLLPYGSEPSIEHALRSIVLDAACAINEAIAVLLRQTISEPYTLLSDRGIVADLFYLPLRLTDVLGWAAVPYHFDLMLGTSMFDHSAFNQLLSFVLENYSTAVVAMSDVQAAPLLSFVAAARDVNPEGAEAVMGLMFSTSTDVRGRIADSHLSADKVLAYMLARSENTFDECFELVANPSELLTVILKGGEILGLDGVFDEDMYALDHASMNAFIANDLCRLGDKYIEEGENFSFYIGQDIWTLGELRELWPRVESVASPTVRAAALLSCLLHLDRCPWFLLQDADHQLGV